jgi:hypothetical protein
MINCAPGFDARPRFVNAFTGSSKNMSPWRDIMVSGMPVGLGERLTWAAQ